MVLIGKRIKELRTEYKFTQTELAEKVGVTKSTIAAYENDSRQPSYEVLVKMADVFNVTIDSILLNRTGKQLDLSGLDSTQIYILELLAMNFRKNQTPERNLNKKEYSYEELMKKHLESDENKE